MTIYITRNLLDLFHLLAQATSNYPPELLQDRRDNWLEEIRQTEAEAQAAEIAADTAWLESSEQGDMIYGNFPLDIPYPIDPLITRREQILLILKEEPITKEQAYALIDELAEIETKL